ncbi:pentapeptide repeat-containing protein [Streptomyces sp. NPDC004610]|uniref:pentapeptide repeat-containing protein n=1 Tax=unclassified Streptomyces TaxID=2593676 RepID=UPI0033AE8ED5
MAPSRPGPNPRTSLGDRELRLWRVGRALTVTFVAAVLVAGGVLFGLVVLLDVQEIDRTAKLDARTLFDLVKLSFGVVAGAGALVALVVAYRRQRVDEAGAHREATRLHTERFTAAVEQLGSGSPAVRLGGVHALAGLADDAPDQGLRQTCIDVLCAYLQLPFTPDPGTDPSHQEEHHRYLAFRKVRHTIMRLIGDHYRRPRGTHRSWQGCDLDLTGVTIDGPMDFTGAEFTGGTVHFTGAEFTGSTVDFSSTVLTGGTVDIGRAVFSGGTVHFTGAELSGSTVDFNGAEFCGGTVDFSSTVLTGGTVHFGRAVFSGGTVHFTGAEFTGSTVDFNGAEFSGSTVYFGRAVFSGGTVHFGGVVFSGGMVHFGRGVFSGGKVDFGSVMFSGGTVDFGSAVFSAGTVHFVGAEFSGGTVDFSNTVFSGSTVDFSSAEFSGGTVHFRSVTGPVPSGLLAAVGSPAPAKVTLSSTWLP